MPIRRITILAVWDTGSLFRLLFVHRRPPACQCLGLDDSYSVVVAAIEHSSGEASSASVSNLTKVDNRVLGC